MAIRFHEEEVRPMGLVAAGVSGIKLGARDMVIGMELIPHRGEILLLTSDGKAKRVSLDQFPRQGRYGQGVIAWKLPRTAQLVGIAAGKASTRVTVLLDKLSPKAIRLDEAPLQTRAASGKTVIELKPGYQVLGLSISWVVPRPVAGEKAIPEKEPEVPDEPEEIRITEVEQLTFGMIEPATKDTSKIEKSTSRKPRATTKHADKTTQRKARTTKGAQAALITKTVVTKKAVPSSKSGKTKSPRNNATRKGRDAAKSVESPLIDKKVAKVERTPAKKAGRAAATKPYPAGKSKSPEKTSTVQTKTTSVSAKKPSTQARKTSGSTKSATDTRKEPSTKVGRRSKGKTIKTSADLNSSNTGQTTKLTPEKPASRKPRQKKLIVKNAVAPSVVILPPSWKPKRGKKTPARRIVKPTKSNSDK
jgi:DNA gyrase subunit A